MFIIIIIAKYERFIFVNILSVSLKLDRMSECVRHRGLFKAIPMAS